MIRSFGKLGLAGVSLLALSVPAYAQDKPAAGPDHPTTDAQPAAADQTDKDIVVTGTLLHNTPVVGAQTLSVGATTIAEQGAGTTNELLGALPQLVGTFNGRFEIDPAGFSTGTNSINKPNLRSLPTAGSGTLTLVTMDGMRLAPVGINDAAVDVDIIPSNILAGIDAVTDGGSSLYGADAVGGVLNFRTLRKFDGVKVEANFGFGTKVTSYKEWDGSIMAGHSWDTGNAWVSVSHYDRSNVVDNTVPWWSGAVYNAAGVKSFPTTQCISPVGSTVSYYEYAPGSWTNNAAAPGAGTFPVGTACDAISSGSYSPRTLRTNAFGALTENFTDTISLHVTGYWARRDMFFSHYPVGASTTGAVFVPPAVNPPVGTIISIPGGLGFSFGANSAYVNNPSTVSFDTWGINPELTVKVGGDWQVRIAATYGQSFNSSRFPSVDTNTVASYIASGQLNPLNVAAASAAVITAVTNFETANDTRQELFLVRAIADGSLFALPAGNVKLAVGAEYQYNWASIRSDLAQRGVIDSTPWNTKGRNAKSVFAELEIPVFSFLDLTGSGRYDHYSDFGGTFNPNVGATLKPTNWLKIYGHWDTSFNAPTAIDDVGSGAGRLICGIYTVNGAFGTNQRPLDPLHRDLGQGTCALVLTGGIPGGIKPQTANSWAVGFDATPVHGVNIGAEFYTINADNVIGAINPADTTTYTTNPNSYLYNITQNGTANQIGYLALLSQLGNGASVLSQQPNASNIALVVDSRTSNINAARVQGFDVHANFDTHTGFGDWSLGVNANVPTKSLVIKNGVTVDTLGVITPKWTLSTDVAWKMDRWTVKATVNVRGPYLNATGDYLQNPINVAPYVITNLFIGYQIKDSSGPLNGTSFRLNVDNLFESDPTQIKLSSTNFPSFTNWTLGRVIRIGVTKEFK